LLAFMAGQALKGSFWLALVLILCPFVAAQDESNVSTTIPDVEIPEYDSVTSQDTDIDATERLDLLSATWGEPPRVSRCPVQQTADITSEDGKIQIDIPYVADKQFSLIETPLSVGDLSKYEGIEMQFATRGLTDFKVRLQDDKPYTRFIAAVTVSRDGEHTLWLTWADFHGEEMGRASIKPCTEEEPCGVVAAENISALALLVPIPEDNETWSASFTLHALTADILTSATPSEEGTGEPSEEGTGEASQPSTQVRPSSEAEVINFQDEDQVSMSFACVHQHGWIAWILASSSMFGHLSIFLE